MCSSYIAGMKRIYHWCSKGLDVDLLFANEREFIAGMNRIAVCYLRCKEKDRPVKIIAFCLLNNHFHFILYGEEEATATFMEHYKMLTAQWIARHRKTGGSVRDKLHCPIELGRWTASNPEKAREKVIYTLRQALEAGIRTTPQGYPWGSASLMFTDNSCLLKTCRQAGCFSTRSLKRMMFSKQIVPPSWPVLPNGMIWPGAYTDAASAENLFSGVKNFMFCLNSPESDRNVIAEMTTELPSIPDAEVRDKAEAVASGLLGKKGIGACSAEERIKIAQYLRRELHCGRKQLARIVRMNEKDLLKSI